MMHLVGLTREGERLEQLLRCLDAHHRVMLYPEAADLLTILSARAPQGVTIDDSATAAEMAVAVATTCTLTWFDDD